MSEERNRDREKVLEYVYRAIAQRMPRHLCEEYVVAAKEYGQKHNIYVDGWIQAGETTFNDASEAIRWAKVYLKKFIISIISINSLNS